MVTIQELINISNIRHKKIKNILNNIIIYNNKYNLNIIEYFNNINRYPIHLILNLFYNESTLIQYLAFNLNRIEIVYNFLLNKQIYENEILLGFSILEQQNISLKIFHSLEKIRTVKYTISIYQNYNIKIQNFFNFLNKFLLYLINQINFISNKLEDF